MCNKLAVHCTHSRPTKEQTDTEATTKKFSERAETATNKEFDSAGDLGLHLQIKPHRQGGVKMDSQWNQRRISYNSYLFLNVKQIFSHFNVFFLGYFKNDSINPFVFPAYDLKTFLVNFEKSIASGTAKGIQKIHLMHLHITTILLVKLHG